MKRLAYISPESFIDVDLPIIKELNKHFDLLWIVTFSSKTTDSLRFYFPMDVENYCCENQVKYIITQSELRSRDARRVRFNFNEIIKPIKKFNPEILYFESFYDPYLPILVKLFFNTNNVIIGLHDVIPHSGVTTLFHRLSHQFVLSSFINFHVFSKSQQVLFNQIQPKKKSFIIPLYLKSFGDSISKIGRNQNDPITFLFFGRIYPYKGLDILIKAVNLIVHKTRNFKIIIAGSCADFSQYELMIDDKSVFDLQIKMIPNHEIETLFYETDYLVLPYLDVTQSGPILVAYNYQVPVISSDITGFSEMIENNKTGFLFETKSAESLAECMCKIIELPPNEHQLIKTNLHEYILKEYKIENYIKKYIHHFNAIAS